MERLVDPQMLSLAILQLGLTQEEFAQEMDVSREMVRQWLSKPVAIRPKTLNRIMDKTNKPIEFFLLQKDADVRETKQPLKLRRKMLLFSFVAAIVIVISYVIIDIPPEPVVLRIGLSSEHPEPIERALRVYEAAQDGRIQLTIEKLAYAKARSTFLSDDTRYDIVMLDDPWVPEFADKGAIPISSSSVWRRVNADQPLSTLFPAVVFDVCRDLDDSEVIVGLPILGNVQLMAFRKDKALGLTADEKLIRSACLDSPDRLSALLESLPKQEQGYLISRWGPDADLVEIFWQLLLGYGYTEPSFDPDGSLVIPRRHADAALQWLLTLDPQGPIRKDDSTAIRAFVEEGSPDAMFMFAWPGWISQQLTTPGVMDKLGVTQFSKTPLLGAWVLAMPEHCRAPEEAAKLILTVCANREVADITAFLGGVPAMQLHVPREQQDHPVWQLYRDAVLPALEVAKARPRSKQWRAIESELAKKLRSFRLNDTEKLVRFEAEERVD
jgi:multiple sugar transport system substrate-binding protein